ncbi:hypothetical protein B0H19DRAFT_1074605 [Mycena capillaripes]|nr:hypothetical protein B0H19DRAFT_1074605 [Mycena capillaripes]
MKIWFMTSLFNSPNVPFSQLVHPDPEHNHSEGMFSHSDHHHQSPPGLGATSTIDFTYVSTPDQLSEHYRHLESLLDSALATLTLINATTTTGPMPAYCPRTIQVVQALNHYIATQDVIPTATTPTTTNVATSPPIAAPATYAGITTRSSTRTTPDLNTTKQSRSRSVSAIPPTLAQSTRSSQAVIRLDLNQMSRQRTKMIGLSYVLMRIYLRKDIGLGTIAPPLTGSNARQLAARSAEHVEV